MLNYKGRKYVDAGFKKMLYFTLILLAWVATQSRSQEGQPCKHESYNPSGTYESPNYPEDYPNHADCSYRFFTDKMIEVVFESFAIEETPDCRYDFLNVIFDATSPTARPDRYCGDGLDKIGEDGVLRGAGPLIMMLRSDDARTRGGFKFTYNFDLFGSDPCDSSPCQNGTCERLVEDYRCVCDNGYAGDNCTIDIDECRSHPCKHGGQCIDDLAGFRCECVQNFTGELCETEPDRCLSEPCLNGGLCVNRVLDFVCSCPSTHYGDLCEIEVTTTPAPTTTTTTTLAVTTTASSERGDEDGTSNDQGDDLEIEAIPNDEPNGSSGAAAAAIIICLVVVVVAAVVAWFWLKQKRKSRDWQPSEESVQKSKRKRHKGKSRGLRNNSFKKQGKSRDFDLLNKLQRISQEIVSERSFEHDPRERKNGRKKPILQKRHYNVNRNPSFETDFSDERKHHPAKTSKKARGGKYTKPPDISPEDAALVLNQLLGNKRLRHKITPQEAQKTLELVRQRHTRHRDGMSSAPSILSTEDQDEDYEYMKTKRRLKGRRMQKTRNRSPIHEESDFDNIDHRYLRQKTQAALRKRKLRQHGALDPGNKRSNGPTIETDDLTVTSLSGPERGPKGTPFIETDLTLEDFQIEDEVSTAVRSAFRPIHRNPYKPPDLPITDIAKGGVIKRCLTS